MGLFDRLRGGPRQGSPQQRQQRDAPVARTYLTGTGRDFGGLEENDQPVKFHVSEPIRKALDEMAEYHDSNLLVIVRHIIFVALYGSYDLHALGERGNKEFMPYKARSADRDMQILYSRSRSGPAPTRPHPPDLGKNLDNIKIWLPKRMVDDLDALADEAGSNRSAFLREVLIQHLFGRMQLPVKT